MYGLSLAFTIIFFFKFEGDNNFSFLAFLFIFCELEKAKKKSKTNKNKTNSQKIFLKEDQCIGIKIIVFNQIVGILFFLELKHSKGLNFFQGIKRVKDLREGCTFELSHECLLFFV